MEVCICDGVYLWWCVSVMECICGGVYLFGEGGKKRCVFAVFLMFCILLLFIFVFIIIIVIIIIIYFYINFLLFFFK